MPSLFPPSPLSPSFRNSLFCLLHKPESWCSDSAFAHLALPDGPVHSLHYSGHTWALQTICGSRNTLLESLAFRTAQEFKATVQMTASLCFFTLRNPTTNPGDTRTLLTEELLSARAAAVAGKAGKAVSALFRPHARAPGTAWQMPGGGPGPKASSAPSARGCRGPLQPHCGCNACAPSPPYPLCRWPLSVTPVSHGRQGPHPWCVFFK